jgi:hypothetical protein
MRFMSKRMAPFEPRNITSGIPKMLNNLSGSIIIAQTPFDDRGAVDLASIDTLTDFYLGHGANGFVVLGVSGEGGKLTPQEALDVSSRFIARAGGKPVIVGVSNSSSAQLKRKRGCLPTYRHCLGRGVMPAHEQ